MKHLKRAILCIVALFVFAATGRAQEKSYCLIPPPSPFKHNALIITKYDSAASRMRTTLEHPHILNKRDGEAGDAVYLYASFAHQAPRSSKPAIDVVFLSVARESKYQNSHGVILFTDKEPLPAARAAEYSSRTGDDGSVTEAVKVTLPYGKLLRITNAKKVDVRLGSTDFEFTNNHLEALRELAELIVPTANAVEGK